MNDLGGVLHALTKTKRKRAAVFLAESELGFRFIEQDNALERGSPIGMMSNDVLDRLLYRRRRYQVHRQERVKV
jgi:hypothetical protein